MHTYIHISVVRFLAIKQFEAWTPAELEVHMTAFLINRHC